MTTSGATRDPPHMRLPPTPRVNMIWCGNSPKQFRVEWQYPTSERNLPREASVPPTIRPPPLCNGVCSSLDEPEDVIVKKKHFDLEYPKMEFITIGKSQAYLKNKCTHVGAKEATAKRQKDRRGHTVLSSLASYVSQCSNILCLSEVK